MKGKNGQGLPVQQHIDDTLDRQVEEYSKLYSIEQWLQPRRYAAMRAQDALLSSACLLQAVR
jgi:hypothetical protein